MSAYVDDVTVIMSRYWHIDLIGDALKEYETVTRAKINAER